MQGGDIRGSQGGLDLLAPNDLSNTLVNIFPLLRGGTAVIQSGAARL